MTWTISARRPPPCGCRAVAQPARRGGTPCINFEKRESDWAFPDNIRSVFAPLGDASLLDGRTSHAGGRSGLSPSRPLTIRGASSPALLMAPLRTRLHVEGPYHSPSTGFTAKPPQWVEAPFSPLCWATRATRPSRQSHRQEDGTSRASFVAFSELCNWRA